ncbi:putative secretory pathway protein, partial [Aureobasidium melanogenum]|uniref:Putative secretory pathway protein Ssp120 n=2 Tax=Aureobasidium melanogenum TaxID=46634 RepID=A0A074WQ25_AURM1
MSTSRSISLLGLALVFLSALKVSAHGGGHEQAPIAADADWATRHMAEEHHITSFDAGSFFNLHDYDSSGTWTPDDIRKTYGLKDESTKDLADEKKEEVVRKILELFDKDRSGSVSYAEFLIADAHGVKLPDFGYGPGHHGDDEYEYEIHHFEKFHGDDTTEEDLTHPEDIAHFRKHDMMEQEAERQAKLDRMEIVEANIPQKFRRHGH